MFKHFSKQVEITLAQAGLSENLRKIWIYRSGVLVVDQVYLGIKFSFDVTPTGDGGINVDVLQRSMVDGRYFTPAGSRKARVLSGGSQEDALEKMVLLTRLIMGNIADHLGEDSGSHESNTRLEKLLSGESSVRAKRIGVLTLPLNRNFGGNLQAFALTQVLKKMGHHPILLNRQHPPELEGAPQEVPKLAQPWIRESYGMSATVPNAAFIDKYLAPTTVRAYTTKQLSKLVRELDLDAVIVGSDQVWRAKYARTLLTDFFLGFLPENSDVLRISYAPSFGVDRIGYGGKLQKVRHLVKKFDATSVREDSAVTLCRTELGVEAKHVLDPTLLLDVSDYLALLPPADGEVAGHLLAYVLDIDEEKTQVIRAIERRLGISAYGTNGRPFRAKNALKADDGVRTIENWLASIHRSSFVVTDSFHGVAFSILFNRPFIAYGNPKRGMARFESLLRMFGLEDRLHVGSERIDIDDILDPINWAAVNSRLAELRLDSFSFLEQALRSSRTVASPHAPAMSSPSGLRTTTESKVDPFEGNPLRVLCTGCGVCVSESGGALEMAWSSNGFLIPKTTGSTSPLGARKVCPFNPSPDKEVEDEDALANLFLASAPNFDPAAGRFESCYVGYSKKYRETSSSGGLATYVLEQLIKRRVVDYLFVVQSDGAAGYRYAVCKSVSDFRSISKTRYYPVSMDRLFEIIDRSEGRVAVSAVACFAKAIRLKQYYRPEYRDKIPFVLGIICGGLKSRNYTDFLAKSAGVVGAYSHPDYRVKDPESSASDYSFAALGPDRKKRQIKMQRIGTNWGAGLFKARACDFCSDVLTELAYISLGDAWLPRYRPDGMGHSVVVTRSRLAEEIIQDGIASGDLHAELVPVRTIVESQSGGFNHKHKGLKFRSWVAKYFLGFAPPKLRTRLLTDLTVPEAIVQIHRERTRSKSLAYWLSTGEVSWFRRRIRSSRRALKVATAARKDGSNAPVASLLNDVTSDVAPLSRDAFPRNLMLRWLLSKLRGDLVLLGTLRAAVGEDSPVARDRKA